MGQSKQKQILNAQQSGSIKYQWPLHLLTVFVLIGIGIGGYLTWHHENELYGDSSVSLVNCPENATINCEVVNTSKYSEFLGVPIAVFAIPTYLLILALILFRKKQKNALQSVFFIGLMTSAYSGYLYYISTVKVGYLCLWCFRLYLINLSIPILSGIALWENPLQHFKKWAELFDFKQATTKFAMTTFSVCMVVTLIGQKVYRTSLVKTGKSASLPGAQDGESVVNWNKGAFVVPSKLKMVKSNGHELETVDFDIQSKFGKGKPVALFFHSPGYGFSESTLLETEKYIRENNKNTEFYVVVGRGGDYRLESAWESIKSLPLPKDVTILIDEEHEAMKQLNIQETPNLTLVGGDGTLVALRLRALNALLPGDEKKTTKEVLAQVEAGQSSPQYKITPQYFPSSQLVGKCAPNFTLNDITSGIPYKFTGKSANGKPTLLVFWSSTCKHCQKEIPEIVRHMKANPSKYNVVSVSNIKADRQDGTSHRNITKAYIKNTEIKFPVLVDSGMVNSLFGVISTPTSFVIAPNGEVSEAWYYVHSNLDQAMTKALDKANSIKGTCENYSFPNFAKLQFDMTDSNNKPVSIGKLIDRPSLVHFWATWCGPCQEELPSLLSFKAELEMGKGKVHLVSVEDAESGDKIASFLSKYGKNVTSFRDPKGGLANELNLGYSVPRTYLLNANGEILAMFTGSQKWNDPAFKEKVYAWLQMNSSERTVSNIKK